MNKKNKINFLIWEDSNIQGELEIVKVLYGAIADNKGFLFNKKNRIFLIILLGENIDIIRFFSIFKKRKNVIT